MARQKTILVFSAFIFVSLENASIGMASLENDQEQNFQERDNTFYTDYNTLPDNESYKQILPIWLAYPNQMQKSYLRNAELHKPWKENSNKEFSSSETPAQDPTTLLEIANKIGNFKNGVVPMIAPRQVSESPWKRFGGDTGVFQRFRTNFHGDRLAKQEVNQEGKTRETPENTNNVNSAYFWKENLLPPGIFNNFA